MNLVDRLVHVLIPASSILPDMSIKVMPKISIIVPVYNESGNIRATLESVLLQRYKDYEIIFVDDGSSDDTCKEIIEIAKGDSRVRIIRKNNGGISKALNYGIEHSKGEYIARIDAGDVAFPCWLESQIELLSTEKTELVFASIFLVDNGLKPFYLVPLLFTRNVNKSVLRGRVFPHCFLVAKKALFVKYGMYSENDGIEDHVLWNLYAKHGVRMIMSSEICGMAVREPAHNEIIEKRQRVKARYHQVDDDEKIEKMLLKAGVERYIIYPKSYRANIKIPMWELAKKYKINFVMNVIKSLIINVYVKTLIHMKQV